jgi:DNA-binding Lrp family transcriptional regulator
MVDILRLGVTRNIHTVFGEYDIVMAVQDRDFNSIGQIVIDKVRSIPGVEDTMTLASCTLADMKYGNISKGL